jgi:hypothetical protein
LLKTREALGAPPGRSLPVDLRHPTIVRSRIGRRSLDEFLMFGDRELTHI